MILFCLKIKCSDEVYCLLFDSEAQFNESGKQGFTGVKMTILINSMSVYLAGPNLKSL